MSEGQRDCTHADGKCSDYGTVQSGGVPVCQMCLRPFPSLPKPLDVRGFVKTGDPREDGQDMVVGYARVGSVWVTVYESRREPGRVVVEIDKDDEAPESLAVAVNDHYVVGGPANVVGGPQ